MGIRALFITLLAAAIVGAGPSTAAPPVCEDPDTFGLFETIDTGRSVLQPDELPTRAPDVWHHRECYVDGLINLGVHACWYMVPPDFCGGPTSPSEIENCDRQLCGPEDGVVVTGCSSAPTGVGDFYLTLEVTYTTRFSPTPVSIYLGLQQLVPEPVPGPFHTWTDDSQPVAGTHDVTMELPVRRGTAYFLQATVLPDTGAHPPIVQGTQYGGETENYVLIVHDDAMPTYELWPEGTSDSPESCTP